MLTLNETRTQLRVGRRRLMLLLDELQIKPVQVHAKRPEITPEQFQQLQQHLQGTEDPQPDQTSSTSTSTNSSTSSTSDSTSGRTAGATGCLPQAGDRRTQGGKKGTAAVQ